MEGNSNKKDGQIDLKKSNKEKEIDKNFLGHRFFYLFFKKVTKNLLNSLLLVLIAETTAQLGTVVVWRFQAKLAEIVEALVVV